MTTQNGITIKFCNQNAVVTTYSIDEKGKETVYHSENRTAEYTEAEVLENFIDKRSLYGSN